MAKAGATEDKPGRWQAWRESVARRPALDMTYRIAVGVIGIAVLLLGILAIPYPGPGWLIVFAGLGILASEFAWAQAVLHWVKHRYDLFMDWFGRQGLLVQAAGVLLTTVVVVATLWVLGTFSMVAGWFGLDRSWLHSPL